MSAVLVNSGTMVGNLETLSRFRWLPSPERKVIRFLRGPGWFPLPELRELGMFFIHGVLP